MSFPKDYNDYIHKGELILYVDGMREEPMLKGGGGLWKLTPGRFNSLLEKIGGLSIPEADIVLMDEIAAMRAKKKDGSDC